MEKYLKIVDQINQKFEEFKLLVLQETNEVEKFASFQLTPQQEIMMSHIIRQKPITANDIAMHLNISKSAVSQVITKLEEQTLIFRKTNPDNRREAYIYLGKRGEEYHQVLQDIDEMLVRKYYSKTSLEELENVLLTFKKIIDK